MVKIGFHHVTQSQIEMLYKLVEACYGKYLHHSDQFQEKAFSSLYLIIKNNFTPTILSLIPEWNGTPTPFIRSE